MKSKIVNWDALLANKRNLSAVRRFVDGQSIRSIVKSLTSKAAKTEAYRLERHFEAETARKAARAAIDRRS